MAFTKQSSTQIT